MPVCPKPLNARVEARFPASGIAPSSSLLYRLFGFDFFLLLQFLRHFNRFYGKEPLLMVYWNHSPHQKGAPP